MVRRAATRRAMHATVSGRPDSRTVEDDDIIVVRPSAQPNITETVSFDAWCTLPCRRQAPSCLCRPTPPSYTGDAVSVLPACKLLRDEGLECPFTPLAIERSLVLPPRVLKPSVARHCRRSSRACSSARSRHRLDP
jgi:hypothetical protein